MNQITHWLDASNIYGSAEEEAEMLRLKQDGKLRSSSVPNHGDNLPVCEDFEEKKPHVCSMGQKFFAAGEYS